MTFVQKNCAFNVDEINYRKCQNGSCVKSTPSNLASDMTNEINITQTKKPSYCKKERSNSLSENCLFVNQSSFVSSGLD